MTPCVGCARPRNVPEIAGWEDLSPIDMLREAGRIVCDADPFGSSGISGVNSRQGIRSNQAVAEGDRPLAYH